jgi:hypothetical protein
MSHALETLNNGAMIQQNGGRALERSEEIRLNE